jgi:probable HAF family extracellular repeat protein
MFSLRTIILFFAFVFIPAGAEYSQFHAFKYSGGTWTDLGTLGGLAIKVYARKI